MISLTPSIDHLLSSSHPLSLPTNTHTHTHTHTHIFTIHNKHPVFSISQRIGYLAASQCFHDDLDVVMLTTNMIRKDISSHNQYDASLALNGLACFMTPDLARYDLLTSWPCLSIYYMQHNIIVVGVTPRLR